MNNLCSICMRGGSKGVKNKNLKKLNGKPLMAYTIEQAITSQLFKHVIVSTDSEEIYENAKIYENIGNLKTCWKIHIFEYVLMIWEP